MNIQNTLIAGLSASFLFFSSSIYASGAAHEKNLSELLPMCTSCHGETGQSPMPVLPGVMVVPHLAGQHADYLEKALHDYKSGARNNPTMVGTAANLSEHDIKTLAQYFSAQSGLSAVKEPHEK